MCAALFVYGTKAWIPGNSVPLALTVTAALLVGIILTVGDIMRQVYTCKLAEELMYLSMETSTEAGPVDKGYNSPVETFFNLKDFLIKLRLRGLSRFMCRLFVINPSKIDEVLDGAAIDFSKSSTLDQVRAIAGPVARLSETCRERYGAILVRLSGSLISVPAWSVKDARIALRNFDAAVEAFSNCSIDDAFSCAKKACISSRKAGFYVHCVGYRCFDNIELNTFDANLVATARYMENCLSDRHFSDKEIIQHYINSVVRRREALQALRSDQCAFGSREFNVARSCNS